MRKILLAALLIAVLLTQVALIYHYVAPRQHYVFDFTQRWLGARAMLLERRNPYSQEVTDEIQMALIGRLLPEDSCQQGFLYPPFLAFTVPHFLLPYRLGLSTWLVTVQVLLVASVWLIVRCTSGAGRVGTAHLLLLTLAAVVFRYSLLNLGFGQFSILVLFWIAVAWWLWEKERFLLAGIALALVTSKPQLALLLVPMWLMLALAQRRWRFVAGFGAAMGLLLALPFLFLGNWIPELVNALVNAIQTCQTPVYEGPSFWYKLPVFLILTGGLFALTLLSPRYWQGRRLGYLLSLGVATTMLSTPFTHSYDLVLTLFPLLFGLVVVRGLPGRSARLLEVAFWATLVVLPWLMWALTPNHQPDLLERWLFPTVVLGLLAGLAAVGMNRAGEAHLQNQD
jgi:hypothetical protein